MPTNATSITVTEKLKKLYMIDLQIRGLSKRVLHAENFLRTQSLKLNESILKEEELESRLRQHRATSGNLETELASIDEKIDKHRTELNSAVNNKQYAALLNEVTLLKESRNAKEELTLAQMESIEELSSHLHQSQSITIEKKKTVDEASKMLEKRKEEVKERLEELNTERSNALNSVPNKILEIYNDCSDANHGEAMATIDEIDSKRRQYSCGSCFTMLPFDLIVTAKSGSDQIVKCPSCQRILRFGERIDFEE